MTKNESVWLFSYGTLREPDVQLEIFGRCLDGEPDQLVGYCLEKIRVDDEQFVSASGSEIHRTLRPTGRESDAVDGMALAVSREELRQADSYEPAGYHRVCVTLVSGRPAWVYLSS